MHVIATAGHVDHGKSTLVRALTGSDPDRLDEERRRGLSIELGYCWTSLPDAGEVAFVDVPGHERFVSTMLAGVGPVPAVLFVVAADDPWMPQAEEHLRALDALGVTHGVLAVTRSDLAPAGPALERARARLSDTSLRDAATVTVSGRSGEGLDELRRLLAEMARALPAPDPDADVRLWLDRRFHVQGAGTVVTGTLQAGRVCAGQVLAAGSGRVRVRAVQSLGVPVSSVQGVARVALNVAGPAAHDLDRGDVLVTPDAWELAHHVDVRVAGGEIPERPMLHVGAAAVTVRARPLGRGLVRLHLDRPLPLRIGDRALLRDPGDRSVWAVSVLDPTPPSLRRRGAARLRAEELSAHTGAPEPTEELRLRGVVRLALLRRLGVDTSRLTASSAEVGALVGDWVVSEQRAHGLRRQLETLVHQREREQPLHPGVPVAEAAHALDLPALELVPALVREPLAVVAGRVTTETCAVLPDEVEEALAAYAREMEGQPFAAPTTLRLRELGLDASTTAAAVRAGRLLRVGEGTLLPPGADETAVRWLRELPQPFTTAQARDRLGSSRRVVLPLLAHLDRVGRTRRLPDDRRVVREGRGSAD